jgi:hypothetical protein
MEGMGMSDIALIVIVLVIAIGGLVGVASLLDRRRKGSGAIGPELPEPGPAGRALVWILRLIVAAMLLSVSAGVILRDALWIWIALGLVLLYSLARLLLGIIRLAGK